MKAHCDDIDFDAADAREREVRHDVMAHVYAFGNNVRWPRPSYTWAPPVVLWRQRRYHRYGQGAGDRRRKIVNVLSLLSEFAMRYRDMPTLGYTISIRPS
jgi:adenylosuccinate lyase